jgi:hypothetical protein
MLAAAGYYELHDIAYNTLHTSATSRSYCVHHSRYGAPLIQPSSVLTQTSMGNCVLRESRSPVCITDGHGVALQNYGIQGKAPWGYHGLQRWGQMLQRYLPKGGSQMLRPVVAPGAT